MYRQATFIVLVGFAVITIAFIAMMSRFIFTLSKRINRTKEMFVGLLHNFNHPVYTNMIWNPRKKSKLETSLFIGANVENNAMNDYDDNMARIAVNLIMATYNITGEFATKLPPEVKFIRLIGRSGCYFVWEDIHIIAFRGTSSRSDLLTDLNFSQCQYREKVTSDGHPLLVHSGFYLWWQQHCDDVRNLIIDLKESGMKIKLVITGHSMGSAVATMASLDAADLSENSSGIAMIGCYLFGSPQIGDNNFYSALLKKVPILHSIENFRDIVTQLPPPVAPTFTRNYIYDHFPEINIKRLNFETGSLAGNHHLDSYALAMDGNCPTDWIWNRT